MRILLFILLLSPICSSAQILRAYGVIEIGGFPTSSTTGPKFAYRPADSSFYRWSHGSTWVKIIEPSITSDTIFITDQIGTSYVVSGDTINLTPYLLKSDTTAMLVKYIDRGDTASMLSNYPSTAGYGIIDAGKTWRADSTKLATQYYVQTNQIKHLGNIYNKSSWVDYSDFVIRGTPSNSIDNTDLRLANSSGVFTNTVEVDRHSNLEHWDFEIKFQANTKSTTSFGIGIGMRSTNSYGGYNLLGRINLSTTGTGQLIINQGSGNTQVASSTNAISFTAGDSISLYVSRSKTVVIVRAKNLTTDATEIELRYVLSVPSVPYIQNTGRFSIFQFGGTNDIYNISVNSLEAKNADLMLIGDSKISGYNATNFRNASIEQIRKAVNSVVSSSGGSDRTSDVLDRIDEIIELSPKQVILFIGSNDVRSGVSSATYIANYDAIVDALEAEGIDVLHSTLLYETSINQTTLRNHITSTYAAADVIDTYTCTDRADYLDTDGVHPTNKGMGIIAKCVLESDKLIRGISPKTDNNSVVALFAAKPSPLTTYIGVDVVTDTVGTDSTYYWNTDRYVLYTASISTSLYIQNQTAVSQSAAFRVANASFVDNQLNVGNSTEGTIQLNARTAPNGKFELYSFGGANYMMGINVARTLGYPTNFGASYLGFGILNGASYSEKMRIAATSGNVLIGTTTDVPTSILTARSTTKSSSPFPLHTLAESDAITGVQGNFDYETTQNGLRWYNGTRKSYALESTFARGTATRVPFFDANGQVTESGNMLFGNNTLQLTSSGGTNNVSNLTMSNSSYGSTLSIRTILNSPYTGGFWGLYYGNNGGYTFDIANGTSLIYGNGAVAAWGGAGGSGGQNMYLRGGLAGSLSNNAWNTFTSSTTITNPAVTTGNVRSFSIQPTVNLTQPNSIVITGLYYSPTLTATNGATHYFIESTAGDVFLKNTAGTKLMMYSNVNNSGSPEIQLGNNVNPAKAGIIRGTATGANSDVYLDFITNNTTYFRIAPTSGSVPPNTRFYKPVVVHDTLAVSGLTNNTGNRFLFFNAFGGQSYRGNAAIIAVPTGANSNINGFGLAINNTGAGNWATASTSDFALYVNNDKKIGINNVTSPARNLHVNGEVRITDLTTDPPTQIVGADGDGDLGALTLSDGAVITAGVLKGGIYAGSGTLANSITRALISPDNKLLFTQKYNSNADSSFIHFYNVDPVTGNRSVIMGLTDTVHTGGIAYIRTEKDEANDKMQVTIHSEDQDGTSTIELAGNGTSLTASDFIQASAAEIRLNDGEVSMNQYGVGNMEAGDLSEFDSKYIVKFSTTGKVLDYQLARDTFIEDVTLFAVGTLMNSCQELTVTSSMTGTAPGHQEIRFPDAAEEYRGKKIIVFSRRKDAGIYIPQIKVVGGVSRLYFTTTPGIGGADPSDQATLSLDDVTWPEIGTYEFTCLKIDNTPSYRWVLKQR